MSKFLNAKQISKDPQRFWRSFGVFLALRWVAVAHILLNAFIITNTPKTLVDEDFNITISHLSEKLGISAEFQEEFISVGGNVEFLAQKL